MQHRSQFTPQLTADGSYTFFSTEFGETFHVPYGAIEETNCKFIEPTQLTSKAQKPVVHLLDICYGLGYNTAAALAAIWAVNPHCRVEWIGLELNPEVYKSAIAQNLLNHWPTPIPELLSELALSYQVRTNRLDAQLLVGDARQTIQQVYQSGFQTDAIFLDPFSPPKCPQLWTVEFLSLVASCLKPDGYLATYSGSAAVRTALIANGLQLASIPSVGRQSFGTLAFKGTLQHSYGSLVIPQLSQQECEHLQTRTAIPYRDPQLCDSPEIIVRRRKIEQQTSCLEPTSEWKKRWCFLECS